MSLVHRLLVIFGICIVGGALLFVTPVSAASIGDAEIDFDSETAVAETDGSVDFEVTDVDDSSRVGVSIDFATAYANSGSLDVGDIVVSDGVDGDERQVSNVDDSGSEISFTINTEADDSEYIVSVPLDVEHPHDPGEYAIDIGVENGGVGDSIEESYTLEEIDITHPARVPAEKGFTVEGLVDGHTYTIGDVTRVPSDGRVDVDGLRVGEAGIDGPGLLNSNDKVASADSGKVDIVSESVDVSFGSSNVDNTGDETEVQLSIDVTPQRQESDLIVDDAVDILLTADGLDRGEVFGIVSGESLNDQSVRSEAEVSMDSVESGDAEGIVVDGVEIGVIEGGDEVVFLDTGSAVDVTADFNTIDADMYDFEASIVDGEGNSGFGSISVDDAVIDGDIEFERTSLPAGDYIRADVTFDGSESGYIVFGGSDSQYMDVLYVEDGTELVINTRLVGTSASESDVYRAEDGSVVSYAHGTVDGPETTSEESDVFSDLEFVDADGDVIADSLAEMRDEAGLESELSRPLQPTSYQFSVGVFDSVMLNDQGAVEHGEAVARETVLLSKPEIENITTYTSPSGTIDSMEEVEDIESVRDVITESDTVAKSDTLVVEVEAGGIFGAFGGVDDMSSEPQFVDSGIHPQTMAKLLSVDEGIEFDIGVSEGNISANEKPSHIDFESVSTGNVRIIPTDPEYNIDDTSAYDRFFVLVDVSSPETFTDGVSDEATVDVDMSYVTGEERYEYNDPFGSNFKPDPFLPKSQSDQLDEWYPYYTDHGESNAISRSVSIEPVSVTYSTTTASGEMVVDNRSDTQIDGETNLAPESDAEIEFGSTPDSVTTFDSSSVGIADDGTFTVSSSLEMLTVDDNINVDFYTEDNIRDRTVGTVVGDVRSATDYRFEDYTSFVAIAEGQQITGDDLTAQIANHGSVDGATSARLFIEGEEYGATDLNIGGGESVQHEFSTRTLSLSPGDYEYTLTTDDETVTGTIRVVDMQHSNIQIESVQPDDVNIPESQQTITYTTTLYNDGDTPTEDVLIHQINGDTYNTQAVSMSPGETDTVDTELNISTLENGTHTTTIASENDQETAIFEIGGDDSDGLTDVGNETETINGEDEQDPEDEDEDGIELPFGFVVTSRSAIAGVAIGGAIYTITSAF